MRLAIGDADGNLLGISDVEGAQWQLKGNAMVNVSTVSVQATRWGIATYFSFVDGEDNILELNGALGQARQLGTMDTIVFLPGRLSISWDIAGRGFVKLPPVLARLK